jgi:hypothetical protein
VSVAWRGHHRAASQHRATIGSLILDTVKGESWRQEGHRWPWQRQRKAREDDQRDAEEMAHDQERKRGDISGMVSPTTTAAGDADVAQGKQAESDEKSVSGA